MKSGEDFFAKVPRIRVCLLRNLIGGSTTVWCIFGSELLDYEFSLFWIGAWVVSSTMGIDRGFYSALTRKELVVFIIN